jgi:hypothetical protein
MNLDPTCLNLISHLCRYRFCQRRPILIAFSAPKAIGNALFAALVVLADKQVPDYRSIVYESVGNNPSPA